MTAIDVPQDPSFGLRTEQGAPPQTSPPMTDGGDAVFGAAFRQSNSVVSALQYLRNSGSYEPVPGYNPVDDIKGWKRPNYFLEHGDKFVGSQSPAETYAIKDQIDQETADKQVLAANGKIGFIAQTVAGSLDPTMLLPGGVALDAAKGGLTFTKAAVEMGKAGFMQTVSQEALLHATQQTRTFEESAVNVASGTLLTALIGGAAASLLSPAERAAAEAALHTDRAEMNAHAGNPSTGETPFVRLTRGKGDQYHIRNQSGEIMATAEIGIVSIDGKKLAQIDDIYTPALEGVTTQGEHEAAVTASRNAFGTSQMREAMRQFREMHPDVEGFTGNRVSGARNAGKMGSGNIQNITVPFGERPPQSPSAAPGEAIPPGAANANEPAGGALAASAGAAATDARKLELVDFGLNKIPGVRTVVEKTSPMQRVFGADSPTARRTGADLAETSLLFKENLEGKVTTAGPALDREAKLHIHQGQVAVGDELSSLFSQYRFGEQRTAPRARAGFEDLTGRRPEGKMSFAEFKEAVSDAMRAGDQHEIPQVQQAAQAIRNKIFDLWKKRTIDAGLLDKDIDVKTADSYLQRLYNKQAIAAKRPEFVDRVTDWLAGDQQAKAEAQTKIGFYQGALESHEQTISKLERQIDSRHTALDDIEARQEEVRRFNEFAFKRSDKLSDPLDTLRAQIRTVETKIVPHLERLETIREQIGAQKDLFPQIREADRLVRRLGEASQRMREARDVVEAVDAAGSYAEDLNTLITDFRAEIRAASREAREMRFNLGADELVALEDARSDINAVIVPQQKQLRKLRKELREERASRIQNARGGAVFETQIRGRGNALADRASAKDAEIAQIEEKLSREMVNRDAMRAKIEEQIATWEGKSSVEAKAALKARAEAEKARDQAKAEGTYKGKDERLSAADRAVDKAVNRILGSDRDLSRDEIRSRAQEITDRIIGSPDGRLPYDLGMEHGTAHGGSGEPPRGALAAREFNIPDATIKDFLENDIEHIVASHLRTVVPDVLLTEKFGDTRMTEAFRKINDEYAALVDAAKSEKERTRLEKERQGVISDLAGIRDRITGTYAISSEAPMRNAARAAAVLKNYNVLTSMGSAALSSLPDMAGVIARHGLTSTFNDAWVPFFKMLTRQDDLWKEAGKQYRAMGIAVESVLASRHHALTDTLDTYHPQSRVERTMQWATGKFQFVNMLAPWTDFAKINASMVAGSEILRATKAASEGVASARMLRTLGESGIELHMASRIAKAFEEGGEIRDGVHLPNTADWKDVEARRVFEGAVARDADISVLTPGQEKPLWMSHPILSVIGQFKSFTAAATERILISNLQRRDAQVLQGLIFSMGLGMLSYKLNSLTGGQPTSDKPQDWVKEAISRGGMLGWFEEANALASKTTRGGVDVYRMIGADKPLSRYASRSAMDQLLGPTAGKIGGILAVGSAASKPSEWNEADSKALRRLIAGQNVFWLRNALDQVEKSGNNAFGIEMKGKRENR